MRRKCRIRARSNYQAAGGPYATSARSRGDLTSGGIDGLMDGDDKGVADDAGLSLPADLNRRRPPAHLAEDAAGKVGALLRGDGGLADHRRPRRPSLRHQPRPPRPPSRPRPRAREAHRPALGLPRRPALTQGASAGRAVRGTRPARRRLEVGDRAVRHRLTGRADDAADAGRLRRVRTRHHRRPRHRRTRTPRPRRQMDERPHPLRLHPRQRHEAARSGFGEGAGRAAHLHSLRGREAGHHGDRARSRSGGGTAAAQAGLVAERAAADPCQPRLPRPRPLERRDPSGPARAARRRRHLREGAGDPPTPQRGRVAAPWQPERLPSLRVGPLPPLRPRLRRHLSARTQRPLHLLRLLHPLQVRPFQVHRRPAPQGPARSRRPHPTRRAVPRRRCDRASTRRPRGGHRKRASRTRRATRIDACGNRPRRRQAGTLLRGLRRRPACRRPLPRPRPRPP